METWIPFLGLKMTSAKRGISDGETLLFRSNLLKIEDTRTFSSINANLQIMCAAPFSCKDDFMSILLSDAISWTS